MSWASVLFTHSTGFKKCRPDENQTHAGLWTIRPCSTLESEVDTGELPVTTLLRSPEPGPALGHCGHSQSPQRGPEHPAARALQPSETQLFLAGQGEESEPFLPCPPGLSFPSHSGLAVPQTLSLPLALHILPAKPRSNFPATPHLGGPLPH